MTGESLSSKVRATCVGLWMLVAVTGPDEPIQVARKPGIEKLECRQVEAESSVRVTAFDVEGEPADGLWVDAVSQAYGREQSVQIDKSGVGKLWVGRDHSYEIHAYGRGFAGYLKLREVTVPLGCELQVRVTVVRRPIGTIIF